MNDTVPPLPLRSESQALAAARAAAARMAELAQDPAHNEPLPVRQAQWLSDYGLTAIAVPLALGGLGASVQTQVDVVRIISSADGGVGQLLQIHYVMLRSILEDYSENARQRIISDVLAGKRLANALAEVGGKNKFALKTRVQRQADGRLVLNGSKFYSTGAYLADWIWLAAASEQGGAGIWLHRDTPGLVLVDDWRAFGQQHSVSGTVRFEEVVVHPDFVLLREGPMKRTGLTFPQILHAAIDTGIAAGALQAGIDYLRQHARAWVESGVERASEEPHVIRQVGEFAVALRAAESLLRDAARLFDQHLLDEHDPALQSELILAVATARAHADSAALNISSEIFSLLGASAALSK